MNNDKKVDSKENKFLKIYSEKENFNQYWFSEKTINFIVNQVETYGHKCAFVSTPSIFFSCNSKIQENSYLFEFDEKLIKKHKNGVKFDFNNFTDLSDQFYNYFDFIVVDPPFITEFAWGCYADFIKLISKKENDTYQAKILTCSIAENENMLKKMLNLGVRNFQPSIPHLVYQYNFYTNYEDEELSKINPELN